MAKSNLKVFGFIFVFLCARVSPLVWGAKNLFSRRISCSASSNIGEVELQTDNFEILRNKLKGTCVYIIGMMGSGKSSLGDNFARKLGYRFIDTDEVAEFMVEMPISEYFALGKEKEFRELEYQILMEMQQYTRVVTSTGGGIVEKRENWGILRHGLVVFLDMKPADIYERLMKDKTQIEKRPLLRGENPLQKLEELSDRRRELYMQADLRLPISAEATLDELSETLCGELLQFIAQNQPLWKSWKEKRAAQILTGKGLGEGARVAGDEEIEPDAVSSSSVDEGNAKPQSFSSGQGFGKVTTVNSNAPAPPSPSTAAEGMGSIHYVKLSDIKSGKVKLPNRGHVAGAGGGGKEAHNAGGSATSQ